MKEQEMQSVAVFMEITENKIEQQEKQLTVLEDKLNLATGNEQLLQSISATIESLSNEIKKIRLPEKEMEQLSNRLDTTNQLLLLPMKKEIVHQHHIPKIAWITAGLFLVFALVCGGWISTASKLDQFIANDTKYRSLRLETKHEVLQSWLDYTDSIYHSDPDLRKIVLNREEENRINFERLQKAARLKEEAKELEKPVKKKR